MSELSLPPGPRGLKFKTAMKMGLGIYSYLDDCYETYGDTFSLLLPGMAPFVWLADPVKVKDFFNLKPDQVD